MITETDEQIKEYAIWSEHQIDNIKHTVKQVQEAINKGHHTVPIEEIVAAMDSDNPLYFIGMTNVNLNEPAFLRGGKYYWKDPDRFEQYFKNLVVKSIETEKINSRSQILLFFVEDEDRLFNGGNPHDSGNR